MAGMEPGTDREYWLNCLAEYELALEGEFNMATSYLVHFPYGP